MKIKKIIYYLFVGFIFCSCLNVFALSKWNSINYPINNTSDGIIEEVNPIKNGKNLDGIDIVFTIPSGYNEQNITISPNIFYSIGEYTYIILGDKIKVNLKITNNSSYDYQFVDNSFILETDDITRFGVNDNFIDTKAVGFDGRVIYDFFSPYRTFNDAILNLFGYTNTKNLKTSDLSDESLKKKLIGKGYAGLDDLDKYYLDYYNNKYNLNESTLEEFTFSVMKEIFSGEKTNYKETNSDIIELAYNYFYNKLLSYNFDGEKIDDSNSDSYSIGEYMRNKLGQSYFKNSFSLVKSGSFNELNNMSLNINGNYKTNIFMYYNLSGYMEFKLKNISNTDELVSKTKDNNSNLDNGLIIPPNTGI